MRTSRTLALALATTLAAGAAKAEDLRPALGAWVRTRLYDVSAFSAADPTGVRSSDAAFQAAQNACAGVFPGHGTMFIPAGQWKLSTGFQWKPGCSIQADRAAHIFAGAAGMTDLMHGGVGPDNSLQNLEISGGVWDCGGKTRNGWTIPDFLHVEAHNYQMINCVSDGGGGISLGQAQAAARNKFMTRDYNIIVYGSVAPTVVRNSYGVYTPEGGDIANNYFGPGEIVGYDQGFYASTASSHIDGMHIWSYANQGGATAGIHLVGYGPVWIDNSEVDGPINGSAFWFTGTAQAYFLRNSEFYSVSNDARAYAMQIDPGAVVSADGDNFHGDGDRSRLISDVTGDVSRLSCTNTVVTHYSGQSLHCVRNLTGAGSPQSKVHGNPGDTYLNTAGGASTTFYVKESGADTNTGWTAK